MFQESDERFYSLVLSKGYLWLITNICSDSGGWGVERDSKIHDTLLSIQFLIQIFISGNFDLNYSRNETLFS